jgi:hypothetical protein
VPPSGEYNFTTITISPNWILRFTRNTANTAVIFRASGNVTISGTITVNAVPGGNANQGTILGNNGGAGGPGGFDGGAGANGIVSTTGGAGLGPGGGAAGSAPDVNPRSGGGAGFAAAGGAATQSGGAGGPAYGTSTLLPLIGGSGGGGGAATFGFSGGGGGGGGGAIVIASSGTLTLNGVISARGGNASTFATCCPTGGGGGAGSGGAVRLVATTIAGTGTIDVSGGTPAGGFPAAQGNPGAASNGRIRIEGYSNTGTFFFGAVAPSIVTIPAPIVLPNTPTVRITSVAGVSTPASPGANFAVPDVTLASSTVNPVTVALTASQIPLGTTIQVTVRGQRGAYSSAISGGLTGTLASSSASVQVTVPTDQPCVISATATFERVATGGEGRWYAGERIERVRTTATSDGRVYLTYVTASGRHIEAAGAR